MNNAKSFIVKWFPFIIAGMSVIALAFSLVIVSDPFGLSGSIYGSPTGVECGFQILGFSSEFISGSYEWGTIIIGVLCWLQLLSAVVGLIVLTALAVKKSPRQYRVQMFFSVFLTVWCFLYMLEGIVYSSITKATYPALYDVITIAYIPFILEAGLLTVYLIFRFREQGAGAVKAAGNIVPGAAVEKSDGSAAVSEEDAGVVYKLDGGMTKILRVYDDRVTLQAKKNLRSFMTSNFFGGVKEIFYESMLGVQFKEAGAIVAGYIQFETANSHAKDNFNSENSFTFDNAYLDNATAKQVVDFVRGKMRAARQGTPSVQVVQQQSAAEELTKLKGLLDAGVITQEEFDAQKKKLLG